MESADKRDNPRDQRRLGLRIGSGVVFFAVLAAWIWWWTGQEGPGALADGFGGINALFSGLAFAGVIVAILLQREELRLQRQELRETRTELRRQADAAEKQEQALEAQRRATLLAAGLNATVAQRTFLADRITYLRSIGSDRSRAEYRELEPQFDRLNEEAERLRVLALTDLMDAPGSTSPSPCPAPATP